MLTDCSSVGLLRLGLARRDGIASDKPQYPVTRQLARRGLRKSPDIQGLTWTPTRAIVLFEARRAGVQRHVQALDEPIVNGPHLGILMTRLSGLVRRSNWTPEVRGSGWQVGSRAFPLLERSGTREQLLAAEPSGRSSRGRFQSMS